MMSKRPIAASSRKDAATLAKLLAQSSAAKDLRDKLAESEPSPVRRSSNSISSMASRLRKVLERDPTTETPDTTGSSTQVKAKTAVAARLRVNRPSPPPKEPPLQGNAAATLKLNSQLKAAKEIQTSADFGRLVRKAREEKGLSQQEFADLTGVGRRFISELENGKPTVEFGKALKVALGAGIAIYGRQR